MNEQARIITGALVEQQQITSNTTLGVVNAQTNAQIDVAHHSGGLFGSGGFLGLGI